MCYRWKKSTCDGSPTRDTTRECSRRLVDSIICTFRQFEIQMPINDKNVSNLLLNSNNGLNYFPFKVRLSRRIWSAFDLQQLKFSQSTSNQSKTTENAADEDELPERWETKTFGISTPIYTVAQFSSSSLKLMFKYREGLPPGKRFVKVSTVESRSRSAERTVALTHIDTP